MTRSAVVLAVLLTAAPAGAQTAAPTPSPQAYYEFMMARRLEADGDAAGALAALERARKLDPDSAELHAELAGFYARQSRTTEAVAEAEKAVALDKDNVEAHRLLGQIYSAWADRSATPPAGETPQSLVDKAIEHLAAIQSSPLMATDPNLQLTLGRLYLRAGKAKEATPVIEKVAAQVPWSPEPFALLAEAKAQQGRLDEAADALASAAEINPRYYVALGDLFERQSRWPEAAQAYGEAAGSVRAPSRDLRMRWANALVNVPEGAGAGKARELLKDLVAETPDDARALYLLATADRAVGDLDGAEAAARQMMDLAPSSLAGLQALAGVLFDRFAYRDMVTALAPFAKDAAARSKGHEADGAVLLVQLGIAHLQLGEFDDAIAAFTQAKSLAPGDPDIDAYLVQTNLSARRFDRADALARAALAARPGQPRMVRLRAQALAKAGKVAEANKLLEDGVAAYPDNREYVVGLADLYTDQKRSDDAVRLLEQARKTFGNDETLTIRMAGAYEAGGRFGEAEKEFRSLLAEDPLNANAMNSLGYMLADHGLRLSEAVDLAQRAVKIEPDNPAYLDTLGWALFKSGKVAESVEPLGRAAAALGGSSVIQDHHGDALAKAGKRAEAIAAWERALAGDGDQVDRAAIEKKIKDARAARK